MDCWPGRVSITRPKLCMARPAANRNARGISEASKVASPRTLPFSSHSVSMTTLRCASNASARCDSAVARRKLSFRHPEVRNAARAASIAA